MLEQEQKKKFELFTKKNDNLNDSFKLKKKQTPINNKKNCC